jgi:hypothetical protein
MARRDNDGGAWAATAANREWQFSHMKASFSAQKPVIGRRDHAPALAGKPELAHGFSEARPDHAEQSVVGQRAI